MLLIIVSRKITPFHWRWAIVPRMTWTTIGHYICSRVKIWFSTWQPHNESNVRSLIEWICVDIFKKSYTIELTDYDYRCGFWAEVALSEKWKLVFMASTIPVLLIYLLVSFSRNFDPTSVGRRTLSKGSCNVCNLKKNNSVCSISLPWSR